MIKSSAIIVVGALCCTFATEARVIGTTTSDPCVAVCNEFSAIRRGNGEELCDSPELSICVNETSHGGVCTNLYWAVTDDGQRGLTYGTNWDDLTPEERSNLILLVVWRLLILSWPLLSMTRRRLPNSTSLNCWMPSNHQPIDNQHYGLVRKHLGNIHRLSNIFCTLFFLQLF